MTNTTTELERQIEQMVAAHGAALRKAAQCAVERAFAGVERAADKRGAGSERLATLGERFFEVLSRGFPRRRRAEEVRRRRRRSDELH